MGSDQTRFDYQGTQVAMIAFDELTHFSSQIFWYMISRIRSISGVPGLIRCTCNPDPDSWVARFIAWWIDWDTGYPIKERSGVLRWFLRRGDDLVWADSKEELLPQCVTGEAPTSLTFIASSIYDNQILLRKDPAYLSRLMSMPLVEREQLLHGNWKIRKAAGTMFRREWFQIVESASALIEVVRYWDRAASVPEETDNPDWTVGVKMGKTAANQFYILDVVRFQASPLDVEQRIRNVASQDGRDVMVALEHDPGQAGKVEASYYTRAFAGMNIRMIGIGGKAKIERATPYSAQVQAGNVKMVRAHWNEAFITEHENFPPTGQGKDDQCLIAGTEIWCERGMIKIEDIKTSDMVMTRGGWRRVEWSGQTGMADDLVTIEAENGLNLTGTKNHLVWTEEAGYVRLDALSGTVTLLCGDFMKSELKRWSSTGSNLEGIQTRHIGITGFITQRAEVIAGVFRHCTEKFINSATDQFRKGKLFTTKTGIHRTIISRIWNWLLQSATLKFTGSEEIGRRPKNQWITPESKRKNGTEARKAESGIENTRRTSTSERDQKFNCFARFVEKLISALTRNRSAVRASAMSVTEGRWSKTSLTSLVKNAVKNSGDSTRKQIDPVKNSAVKRVGLNGFRNRKEKGVPVFNLKVEGCPEYFANGILVHNCDSAGGAFAVLVNGASGAFKSVTPTERQREVGIESGRRGRTLRM
jgi:predicted phage terminase large subunit-like protein